MRLLTPTLCSLSMLAIVGCASKGTVTGTVIENVSNRPVIDANVVLTAIENGKTQSTPITYGGNFSINVKEGAYQVSVDHKTLVPCDTQPGALTVASGQVHRTQICLKQP
ncbi:MAG: carboxypeptidase-like regulatory domain-containing protein [Burkholderiaceae bacterium]